MIEPTRTAWQWGCHACIDVGVADSAVHAVALERLHRAFACPRAPDLDRAERARRVAWWRIRRERYGGPSAGVEAPEVPAIKAPTPGRGGHLFERDPDTPGCCAACHLPGKPGDAHHTLPDAPPEHAEHLRRYADG